MPESSTFRNHDPPRGAHVCELGRRAAGHGDPHALRRWPDAFVAPCGPSVGGLSAGTTCRSRRARGRNGDGSRTPGRSTGSIVIESSALLDEVEELDAAMTWPHPDRDLRSGQVCGVPALPQEGSELELRAFSFSTTYRAPPSPGILVTANFTPGPDPVSGDPAERGTSSRRCRHDQELLDRALLLGQQVLV